MEMGWARYELAVEEMGFQISSRLGRAALVVFSAYRLGPDDLPINNLNDVAVAGRVQFRQARSESWGGSAGRAWESPVLENPTWLDLCVQANDLILVSDDRHHRFLEALEITGQEGGVAIGRLVMNS